MPRPRRSTANTPVKYNTDPFADVDVDLGSDADDITPAEEVSEDSSSVQLSELSDAVDGDNSSDEDEDDFEDDEEDGEFGDADDEAGHEGDVNGPADDEPRIYLAKSLKKNGQPRKNAKKVKVRPPPKDASGETPSQMPKRYKRQKPNLRLNSKRLPTNAAQFSCLKARKRSRITSTFTTNTGRLIQGLRARDRWIDLPLAPARKRLLSRGFVKEFGGEYLDVSAQVLKELEDEKDFQNYFPSKADRTIKVIVGTQSNPISLNFPAFGTHPLGKSLPRASGWMLNVGGEAASLAWVAGPKTEGAETWSQYLIVGIRQNDGEIAFPPSGVKPGGKTSLQIWRFQADASDGRMRCGAGDAAIVALICGDWGGTLDIRVLPGEDCRPDNKAIVGVLAEDGSLFLVEVPLPTHDSSITAAYRLEKPAYTIPRPPPHSPESPPPFYSAFSFASRTCIHTGLSNGYVAAFPIPFKTPIPTYYYPQHESCILSVTSISHRMMAASSTSGFHSLFEFVHSNSPITSLRSRITCPVIHYHRSVNSVIVTDESNTLRSLPLPRFQGGVLVAKHPHSGSIRDVAVSERHTYVCSVGWEGNAQLSNVVRRLFQGKARTWQIVWFKLLWKNGVLRVWEGFRPEEVMKRDSEKGGDEGDMIVWEDESAIVSAAWNEAADSVAGWCAAGSVCGLVRVEDLAVDPLDPPPEGLFGPIPERAKQMAAAQAEAARSKGKGAPKEVAKEASNEAPNEASQ